MTIRCIKCGNQFDANAKVCPNCGEPLTDFLRKYLREPIDGKYEILERLGVGGMGEVYKVRHTFLGNIRVVKVIRSGISDNSDGKERFLREARLATRVQHPNVAALHDFSGLPDGSQYMVWEYIDGQNLAQRIRTFGKLQPRQAVRIAIQALRGLEAIHRAGIVHRDISPENIMLTSGDDRVKIIDLGVAKAEGDGSTQAGMFIGKLRYASPEHLGLLADDERIDGRADLYSLAVVLYEMLDGRPPFEATSPHDYLLIHSKETQFRPLSLPAELPGSTDLQGVMKRALERDREKRYATAADFANVLEAVERTLPDPHDSTFKSNAEAKTEPEKPDTASHAVPDPSEPTAIQTAPDEKLVAPPTVIETAPPPPKKQMSLAALGSIMGALILAIIVMLFILLRPSKQPAATVAETTTTVATTSSATTTTAEVAPPPAPVDTATVAPVTETTTTTAAVATDTVAPPPAPEPQTQTVAPVVTQTVAPKPKRPKKVVTPPPAPVPVAVVPAPAPAPAPAPVTVVRYVEGGDGSTNDAAVAATRREIGSPSSIAIRGEGDADLTTKLVNIVKGKVGVSDGADVVINFNGHIERRGFGRKTRSGNATISKNGQVLFRYEMAPENYRTGDDPAEAFARVLMDVLGR
jgi:serine/threonine protein kinase